MFEPQTDVRPPSVLIVSDHDWFALALGAAAAGWGYVVGRASSLPQALDVAEALNPDLVFVDAWLDVGREGAPKFLPAFRAAGGVGPATPLVVFSAEPLRREDRLQVLRSGAWEVVEMPLDGAVLQARLGAWIAAKRHADALTRASLMDARAQMYNLRGVTSRARELGADAARAGTPLACVAIDTRPGLRALGTLADQRAAEEEDLVRLRGAWAASGRSSDVIGRVGATEYVVLAPRTDASGARVLADRLQRALGDSGAEAPPRVSVLALEPRTTGPDEVLALVGHAVAALQRTALVR